MSEIFGRRSPSPLPLPPYIAAISHFCHRQQCVIGVQRAQNSASFELNKLDTRMKEKAKAVSVCCVQLYVRIMNFGWVLQHRITGSEPAKSHWKSNKKHCALYGIDGAGDEDDFQLPTFELEIEVDKSPPSHKYWFRACGFTAQMG